MNLSPTEYNDYSNFQMAAKRAQFSVLLFELIHDDPHAWLALRDAINKLAPLHKQYLKKVLE
jgi:hypothetical protein